MVKAAKPPKESVPEPVKVSAIARSTVAKVLKALDDHATNEIQELKQYNNPDKASALAILGTKISQMMGEQRKLEADEQSAATKLNHGAVMGYLRNLPPEKRAQVMRELADMDSGRSVLA